MITSHISIVNSNSLTNVNQVATHVNSKQLSSASYCDSGYSLPLNLVQVAYPIKEMMLKKNKRGLRRVFEQIAYLSLFSEERNCFMKQTTLGNGCGKFGEKKLGRKQVGRLENILVNLKLYKRRKPRSDFSFDRHLDPLGVVVYLLLSGRVKYRPPEKMSQPKAKNVPTQFLDQGGILYLNTTSSDSKSFVGNEEKKNAFASEFQKARNINLTTLSEMYRYDIIDQAKRKKNEKIGISSFAQIRKML